MPRARITIDTTTSRKEFLEKGLSERGLSLPEWFDSQLSDLLSRELTKPRRRNFNVLTTFEIRIRSCLLYGPLTGRFPMLIPHTFLTTCIRTRQNSSRSCQEH